MEDEYNVVIDALQTKLNALEKMQKGCDNLNSSIGGGMGLMDCIRYEQMDELREAIKREKALAHVKETPKNEHDSDDVLKRAPLVRLTLQQKAKVLREVASELEDSLSFNFDHAHRVANAIMDAMERVNRRQLDQTPKTPSE